MQSGDGLSKAQANEGDDTTAARLTAPITQEITLSPAHQDIMQLGDRLPPPVAHMQPGAEPVHSRHSTAAPTDDVIKFNEQLGSLAPSSHSPSTPSLSTQTASQRRVCVVITRGGSKGNPMVEDESNPPGRDDDMDIDIDVDKEPLLSPPPSGPPNVDPVASHPRRESKRNTRANSKRNYRQLVATSSEDESTNGKSSQAPKSSKRVKNEKTVIAKRSVATSLRLDVQSQRPRPIIVDGKQYMKIDVIDLTEVEVS